MYVARIKDARRGTVAGTADVTVEIFDNREHPEKRINTKTFTGVASFAALQTLVTADLQQLYQDELALRAYAAFAPGKEVASV